MPWHNHAIFQNIFNLLGTLNVQNIVVEYAFF